ncbi:toxin-antitoxin system TumE family protein [Pinisolibacter aquiterrae]|uniref:toxin-antitoxin system TumE family protein n=1 Tax=Pinisolibacter aquiterrae TaxID=2815579 RepID=UPI001C3DA757|nr:DUF6516 family protein [Pinisolibacter aquiterrae]MBV5265091.1 hypothetical protein [Pinisolibacter aquiterrae]MCC8235579.1 DUF6516 family protein [Pinisolibacter aquiterrae]
MFGDVELSNLIDMAGVYRMANGWQVVIRAEWVDPTPQQPHGIDYALIFQDGSGDRLFGYDNSHAFDGANEDDCWDHEHRAGRTGQRFRYGFVSASKLISDFFDKLGTHCAAHGVSSEFIVDDDHA